MIQIPRIILVLRLIVNSNLLHLRCECITFRKGIASVETTPHLATHVFALALLQPDTDTDTGRALVFGPGSGSAACLVVFLLLPLPPRQNADFWRFERFR